jgi:hypothetical protein
MAVVRVEEKLIYICGDPLFHAGILRDKLVCERRPYLQFSYGSLLLCRYISFLDHCLAELILNTRTV